MAKEPGIPFSRLPAPLASCPRRLQDTPKQLGLWGTQGCLYPQKRGERKKRLDLELQERGLKNSRECTVRFFRPQSIQESRD